MEYARVRATSGASSTAPALLAVAVSPTQTVVAGGCEDGRIRLWAAQSLSNIGCAISRRGDSSRSAVQTLSWVLLPAPRLRVTRTRGKQPVERLSVPRGSTSTPHNDQPSSIPPTAQPATGGGRGAGAAPSTVGDGTAAGGATPAPTPAHAEGAAGESGTELTERLVLLAGYRDGCIVAWLNTPSIAYPHREPVGVMLGMHWDWVRRIKSFDTETNLFVSACADGTVAVWRLLPRVLRDCARRGVESDVDTDSDGSGCEFVAWSAAKALRSDPALAACAPQLRPPFSTPCVKLLHVLRNGAAVFGVSVSPDGALVAAAGRDRCVHVWVVATGNCVATLAGHKGPVFDCCWSRSGQNLASCSQDGTIILWDAAQFTRREPDVKVLHSHEGAVYSATYSPSGAHLASTGKDASTLLWDVATASRLRLFAATSSALCLSWAMHGRGLVVGYEDGGVRLYGNLPGCSEERQERLADRVAVLEADAATNLSLREDALSQENRGLRAELVGYKGRVESLENQLRTLVRSLRKRLGDGE